jgi:glycosyltransferase involved in cell wall biosynthesis
MKLSVIMPVNRLDDFLRQSLLSVNSQTFKDFELLLICNKNIENSLDSFIKSLNLDLKYKIISTILDGVAFSANLGIENSTGDYIARWDSDDLCDPNRFSCQINELDKDKNLHVIGTIVELIDENNNTIKIQKFKFFGDNFSIRKALKYRQSLLHSSLMFRKEILFINNGYLYGHTSEDHELFIRIARDKNINFKNLEHVKTYYRRHPTQLSDSQNLKKHFYETAGFLFSEFLRTRNIMYIFGIIVNIPFLRKFRITYRKFLSNFKK